MAASKSEPAATGHKSAPRPAVAESSRPDEEMRRLLREAAWSRMFGKAGAKNPFARRGR
ncbi:MAG: hypothetical protein ACREFY_21375 [Acetobacteraceae bacterium]